MASIKGISLKNIQKFRGHDGENCYQGNIYFKGKLAGSWSQDAWGGPDRFCINDDNIYETLIQTATDYYAENPYKDYHGITLKEFTEGKEPSLESYTGVCALEMLINDIWLLSMQEKEYKKWQKKGYQIMVVFNYHHISAPIPRSATYLWTAETDDIAKQIEAQREKYPHLNEQVYRGLQDFVIA